MTNYPNGFPEDMTTIKEVNDYHMYEVDVDHLANNPIGVYCGSEGNVCLADSSVLDFLKQFTTGQIFVNYWEEGMPFDPEEWEDDKCVQSLWFHFKESFEISEDYLKQMQSDNDFKEDFKEDIEDYLSSDQEMEDKYELLITWFQYLIAAADGSLCSQGGDYDSWLMFDTE